MAKALPQLDIIDIFTRCASIWPTLYQAQLLITGGTGFFGRWLLESVLYANDQLALNVRITLLSRDPQAFMAQMPHIAHHPAIEWLVGDVRDFVWPKTPFTHVIHAATEASAMLTRCNPLQMLDVIVKGTQHTLALAHHCGAEQVLLTSSGAVYGSQPPNLSHVREDYPGTPSLTNPANAYGIGKATAEHIAQLYSYQHQLPVKIARCFAFVGPHLPLDRHFAIGNFIGNAMRGEPICIQGDGTPYRSYQYAADLAVWLWHILCKGQAGRPYNVGSDEAISIKTLAHQVAACVAPVLPVTVLSTPAIGALAERYVPCILRAQQELQLSNETSLQDSVLKTLAWYQS